MIKEIIIEFKEGEDNTKKRILGAVLREINHIALEAEGREDYLLTADEIRDYKLPKFPGHVVINVFDENERLVEVIES